MASFAGGVVAFGDLGATVAGVFDVFPGAVRDRRDRRGDAVGAAPDGHRVAHVEAVQPGDGVVGPEPGIDPHGQLAASTGAADTGNDFVDEPACPALGVGLSFAHPGVKHLTGVRPRGQDRVIAELVRVAISGALFVFAVDLTNRRVDIDHQRIVRANTASPRPLQRLTVDRFELTDVTEGERPQERPDRRGSHHPMTNHARSRPSAQHVGMIDVGATGTHRVHQRQHLASRSGTMR